MTCGEYAGAVMIGIGIGRDDSRWFIAAIAFMLMYAVVAGVVSGLWAAHKEAE